MNYYSFHVGDYAVHTRHLSLLEDLAYRRMIDLYYTTEKPLPSAEQTARLIGMRDHLAEVAAVLADFFVERDGLHHQNRCDDEIRKYQKKADSARTANQTRWASEMDLKSDTKPDLKSDLKSDAVQILTKNQEPRTKNQTSVEPEGSTPWVAVCIALKAAGIRDVNPSNPLLRELVNAGAEVGEFLAIAPKATGLTNGFTYVLAAVAGERKRAKATGGEIHRGPIQTVGKQTAIETNNRRVADAWLAKQGAIDAG